MKKIPFALVLAFGLASGSAFAASSGTITINGQVMEQTCTIAAGTADQTVTLATVAKADLAASGNVAAKQSFTIQLEDCAAGNVFAFFSADTASLIDPATNTLVNQATTDAATNVNVALYEEKGQQIELGNAAYVYTDKKTVADNDPATLMYSAGYYATGQATAGSVTAVANYTISYQ